MLALDPVPPVIDQYNEPSSYGTPPLFAPLYFDECAQRKGLKAVEGAFIGLGVGLVAIVVTHPTASTSSVARRNRGLFLLTTTSLGAGYVWWRESRRCTFVSQAL